MARGMFGPTQGAEFAGLLTSCIVELVDVDPGNASTLRVQEVHMGEHVIVTRVLMVSSDLADRIYASTVHADRRRGAI